MNGDASVAAGDPPSCVGALVEGGPGRAVAAPVPTATPSASSPAGDLDRHRAAAAALASERSGTAQQRTDADRREQERVAREERIQRRIERRQAEARSGMHRLRPGPSGALRHPWSTRTDDIQWATERALDREVDILARALSEHGPIDRRELAGLVGARYWRPGRFAEALATAVEEGRVRRLSRRSYELAANEDPE